MKLSIQHREVRSGRAQTPRPVRRAVPYDQHDRERLCPYTLEPSTGCKTRTETPGHRCSFTLEPCAG